MKRVIQKCFCLSLAFLLVGATSQVNGQPGPKFVKYCSLFDPSYEGKIVSSSALMFYSTVNRVDGADTFLYSADCNGADYFAIADGNPKVWSKWQNFFDKLPPEENLTLEIKFEESRRCQPHIYLEVWMVGQGRKLRFRRFYQSGTSLPYQPRSVPMTMYPSHTLNVSKG